MKAIFIPAFLIAAGIGLFIYGSLFPEYTDPNTEAQLNAQSWFEMANQASAEQKEIDAVADQWYAVKAKLQTRRDDCHDMGLGVVALGATMAILFLITGISKMSDLRNLHSPKTRGTFYLLATLTWLSFIPAEFCYYVYTDARGDYPPFADVIGIPLGFEFIFGVFLLPIVLLGAWLAIHNRNLPVKILAGSVIGRINLVTISIGIALILAILVLTMGITTRPPIVPSCLFTVYLLLSGRAAAAALPPNYEVWGL